MGFALFEGDPEVQPLCEFCRELDPEYVRNDLFHTKFTARELETSATKAGCKSCGMIWSGLTALLGQIPTGSQIRLKQNIEEPFTNGLQVEVKRDGRPREELEFYTASGGSTPWPAVGKAAHVSGDTASPVAMSLARAWFRRCISNHTLCRSLVSADATLPTRVVHILGPEQIKLHVSSGERSPYVCLSHCWGSTRSIVLDRASLGQFQQSIPFSSLPRTFRDAISVVQQLGIRYMWIDCLSIIQDDIEDWRRESANMASIYANSQFTIAATKSNNHEGGLFATSMPTHKKIDLSDPNDSANIYVRHSLEHWKRSSCTTESPLFPLLSRGWVYQERLLSPRILHFGPHELIWECAETLTCECSGIGPGNPYTALKNRSTYHKRHHIRMLQTRDLTRIIPRWHYMVTEYTSLRLTKELDIFPALSGIVKQMQQYRPDKYVAGLWEDSILEDLLWQANEPAANRPAEWRAPSWSWASVIASISYNSLPEFAHARVVDITCDPAGPDATGELKSAHLILACSLSNATLRYANHRQSYDIDRTSEVEGYRLGFAPDYCYGREGSGHVKDGERVYCAVISSDQHENSEIHNKQLLVLRCLDNEQQVYERIGFLRESWRAGAQGGWVEKSTLEDSVITLV